MLPWLELAACGCSDCTKILSLCACSSVGALCVRMVLDQTKTDIGFQCMHMCESWARCKCYTMRQCSFNALVSTLLCHLLLCAQVQRVKEKPPRSPSPKRAAAAAAAAAGQGPARKVRIWRSTRLARAPSQSSSYMLSVYAGTAWTATKTLLKFACKQMWPQQLADKHLCKHTARFSVNCPFSLDG